jgi:hypothetical protein
VLFTTTVEIRRSDGAVDPYETATQASSALSVAAHISDPSGADVRVGGAKETIDAVGFFPAGTDVARADVIEERALGQSWRVLWVQARTGLGLGHVKAGLVRVSGGASG